MDEGTRGIQSAYPLSPANNRSQIWEFFGNLLLTLMHDGYNFK